MGKRQRLETAQKIIIAGFCLFITLCVVLPVVIVTTGSILDFIRRHT